MSDTNTTETQKATEAQSALEYMVLMVAVVSALVVMSDYVRRAFNAHGNAMEEQLNGAVADNRP